MAFTNNATRLLDSRKISYQVHEYDYDNGIHSAVDVSQAIHRAPEQVFKTLVALPDKPNAKPILAVIPGPNSLDLKKLAKAIGAKKARMATHAQAEEMTGLQTGGISPIVLVNKGFQVYIDASAAEHETIVVSAGQRGANIEIRPQDLINLTRARKAALCE